MPELFNVLSVSQARELFFGHVAPRRRVERVPLQHALDRVVAEDIHAPVDLPAFARSTMDGFAVRAADTYGASEGLPAYLNICGEVPMGQLAQLRVAPSEAARIHTGGMLPAEANAVVMIENTQQLDERMIEVVRAVSVGENVIPVGEDVRVGHLLFRHGHRLRPQDLGGLAGVGIIEISVKARPRVAILATGDEVVPPTTQPVQGQVRDINSTTISALVLRCGGEPILCGIAPDNLETLRNMARAALEAADVLIISAGSSVSTRDMTAQVIGELGQPGVLVHGVAIHPGKPTILAVADGKPVFGLPGNPVSTMIAFELFVAPTLTRLQAPASLQTDEADNIPFTAVSRTVEARLASNVASHPGVEDFVPVRLVRRDGEVWAEPVFGKSNLIYTMARADGLLHIPLDPTGMYAGDQVTIKLF